MCDFDLKYGYWLLLYCGLFDGATVDYVIYDEEAFPPALPFYEGSISFAVAATNKLPVL